VGELWLLSHKDTDVFRKETGIISLAQTGVNVAEATLLGHFLPKSS
jgi:hypothetical protein